MTDHAPSSGLAGLLSAAVVAAGILAGAWVVTLGAADSAWWTLHAGAIVVGTSILIGAGMEMTRSVYPPGSVLSAAFILAVALLASATILGDPSRGGLLLPIWGVGGGFLMMLLPKAQGRPLVEGWPLVGASLLLATGVVIGTFIIAR